MIATNFKFWETLCTCRHHWYWGGGVSEKVGKLIINETNEVDPISHVRIFRKVAYQMNCMRTETVAVYSTDQDQV